MTGSRLPLQPRPGWGPQRTALAWSRTALAATSLAGAALKTAVDDRSPASIVCCIVTALATAGIFVCGQLRSAYEPKPGPPSRRLFQLAAGCALAASIAALVLVV